MKIKLLCLALSFAFSMNATALEIYHGRIISEKEWSTGGNVRANFHSLDAKPFIPKMHTLKGDTGDSLQTQTVICTNDIFDYDCILRDNLKKINVSEVKAPQNMNINSFNYVSIGNTSQETRVYDYQYSLCIKLGLRNTKCIHMVKKIELQANGYYHEGISPQLSILFEVPGTYLIYSSTMAANSSRQFEVTSNANTVILVK